MIVREMKDLFMFYESEMSFEEFFEKLLFFCSHLLNEANDCSKEEEWFHFFVKVKRALKIFFILDDFFIFSDSVMSCEDFLSPLGDLEIGPTGIV